MSEQAAAPAATDSIAPNAQESSSIAPNEQSEASIAPEASAPASSADLKEQVQEALENGDKKEAQRLVEEFELKVNGKTKKVTIDWNNKEDIKRRLQLAEASQPAMQRAADLEKFLQQHAQELRTDPWKVLEQLGLNPDELAETRISKKLEEMEKSPEQKEREKLMMELESLRKEKEDAAKTAEEEKMNRLMEQAAGDLEKEIIEALNVNGKLPKTQKTVRRIYDAMLWAQDNGFDDVQVKDVVPAVEKEIKAEFDEFLANSSEDVLEYYINQKIMDKMRKKRVAAAKNAQSVVQEVKPTTASLDAKPEKDEQKQRIRDRDFFRNL